MHISAAASQFKRALANLPMRDNFPVDMTRRLPLLILALAATGFGLSVAAAQTATVPPTPPPFAVPPFKNLQMLPKDIGRPQLLTTMKSFSQSLGVRCTHCHVGEEGKPLSTFDFASDVKREKNAARKMMAMVSRINAQDFGLADPRAAKVTCFTCHRGAIKPATMPPDAAVPVLPAVAAKPERG